MYLSMGEYVLLYQRIYFILIEQPCLFQTRATSDLVGKPLLTFSIHTTFLKDNTSFDPHNNTIKQI